MTTPPLPPGKRLRGEAVAVSDLDAARRGELFALFTRHYDCVDPARFDADLAGKDHVLLLRDAATGTVRGFSTQVVSREEINGRAVRALFSGDTVIDRAFWGEQELVRAWCRYAGRVLAAEPSTPLFWLLISKGFRTYLYLPLFFRTFLPRREVTPPPAAQRTLDALAARRFGPAYDPAAGLLRFPDSLGQLRPDLAETPAGRTDHPDVRFFLERNPGYARGEELVCLAEIAPDNLRALARRALLEGMAGSG